MLSLRQHVTEQLRLFQDNNDLDALTLACRLLESAPPASASSPPASASSPVETGMPREHVIEKLVRRVLGGAPPPVESGTPRAEKLLLELAVLNHIDAKLLTGFDFDDVPSLSVSPPPETGLPSGVDPASISDARTRIHYEGAIRDNQHKAAGYKLQKRLHKINRQATAQVEAFMSSAYARTPQSLNELSAAIERNITDIRRKSRLKLYLWDLYEQ